MPFPMNMSLPPAPQSPKKVGQSQLLFCLYLNQGASIPEALSLGVQVARVIICAILIASPGQLKPHFAGLYQ